MNKLFGAITILLCSVSFLRAQVIKYTPPAAIENQQVSISVESMETSDSYIYAKLKVKNKTTGYIHFDLKKVGFEYANGTTFPTFGSSLVPPNGQRSSNCKSGMKKADEFDFQIAGVRHASASNDFLSADKLPVAEGATQTIGNFEVEVIKVNKYKKKTTVRVKVTYNGPENQLGVINFKAIGVTGEDAKANKAKIALLSGKSEKSYIDVKSISEDLNLEWSKVFQELTFEDIQLDKVHVQKEGYQGKFEPIHATNGVYKPFVEGSDKPVKVIIYNTNNHGFKVMSEGAERTTSYTTNATLGMDAGSNEIQIMVDGMKAATVNTKLTIAEGIATTKYELKFSETEGYTLEHIEGSAVKVTAVATEEVVKIENTTAATNNACELSFSDFTALQKDIKSEADSGGNPVGLAAELLSVKKCVSTAQVVELASAFNLDGNRLEFAKKAYKHTSDKNKYFQVVQKLSYNKNKEALETFIQVQ
ncbi:MAG: DUF4476 domain-containing protein [Aureispira sp.]|nr:DUF4476 domain-containing protein [Aureispira sp.]